MKKIILLSILLINMTAYPQKYKQGNFWYFGGDYSNQGQPGAGLDFNGGLPVPLTNSGMGYTEGCAAYCSSAGQLLFYANGENVYDNTHNIMLNGDSLGGHWSTAQSSLVVPMSNDTNKYYLFTNDGFPTSNGTGLHYSIIDMTLNNGLGAVTTKAVPLLSGTGEQLTGTVHANGIDFWVLTADYDSCILYAYLVSPTGVASPVISNLGFNGIAFGIMVMSPKGNKISVKSGGPVNSFRRYLCDFDNFSGVVSNPYPLQIDNYNGGCVFSPDGNLFYDNLFFDSLIQYNLNAPNISASAIGITHFINSMVSDMKVGPNNKIYIPTFGLYLHAIEYPNIIGTGCNFQSNAVYLSGRYSGWQLPNITLIPNSSLSVSDISPDGIDFYLAPNPFDNYTTLYFNNSMNETYTLMIFDTQGKLLRTMNNITESQIRIVKENFIQGLYFFQLFSTKKVIVSDKLIIE